MSLDRGGDTCSAASPSVGVGRNFNLVACTP
jgi:hypothetical protein